MINNCIFIGVTGTIGSGKGTVVDCLVSKYGFTHFSVRQFLTEEVTRRGLPDNRESMRKVANELRSEHGSSFLAEQLYIRASESGANAVIESLRNPEEIIALRKYNDKFYLLAVDSEPQIRYERITQRNSSTDSVSYEEFIADEQLEMANPDPNAQKIKECIQMADFKIDNNGGLEALEEQIDNIMSKLQ